MSEHEATKRIWKRLPGTKGIRFFEHATRKHNRRPDRYFSVRWTRNGRDVEEGIGWSSEGWQTDTIIDARHTLQKNYKRGLTPSTFAELREEQEKQRRAREAADAAENVQAMTFREFFERYYVPWKRDRRKRRTWLDDLKRANHRIFPFMGDLPLDAITSELLEEYMDELYADGLADGTVLHHIAIVRSVFNRAANTTVHGVKVFPGVSPVDGIELPRSDNPRTRYLTRDEADLLLQSCREREADAPRESIAASWRDLHDAIVLSLNTGLRLGEIQRLEWADLNFFGQTLTVRQMRDRKPGGTVPLNKVVTDMLKGRLAVRDKSTPLVFVPKGAGRYRKISHMFRDLVLELGLNADVTDSSQKLVFHSLRHSFASWLALAGVDIYRIKTLMRHKTITMTMRYAHLIPDASRGAVELLCTPPAASPKVLYLHHAKTADGPVY